MYTIDNLSYIYEIIGGGGLEKQWVGGVVDETMKGQIVTYILLKCYLK